MSAIHRSSDRIAELARGPSPSTPSRASQPPAPAPLDLKPAVELLRRERFTEAMDLMHALPTSSEDDPDAQLLRAVLLTNSNKLREAEQVCARILAADELNAGAHYLMALCREHAGDRGGARDHDQTATYLDAGFALPHLHLGLLARRAGDMDRARAELGRALELLAREDASRILLFGGGFSREALVALCRSELQASGGGS
jgi:chemotaxis protein methyltransferase CheR